MSTAPGAMVHEITLMKPAPDVPGADRTYVPMFATNQWAAIEPATAAKLEKVMAGSTVASASHLVTIWYLAGVTTLHQLIFHDRAGRGDRIFTINGVHDDEERHEQLILACAEVTP